MAYKLGPTDKKKETTALLESRSAKASLTYKVKCVSSGHKKQLYPYGSKEPLETAGCFTAKVAVEDVALRLKQILL